MPGGSSFCGVVKEDHKESRCASVGRGHLKTDTTRSVLRYFKATFSHDYRNISFSLAEWMAQKKVQTLYLPLKWSKPKKFKVHELRK